MARQPMLSLAFVLVIMLLASPLSHCEASGSSGVAGGAASWAASERSVQSLAEPEDIASLIFTGSELHRSSSSAIAASTATEPASAAAAIPERRLPEATPDSDAAEGGGWEADFAAGIAESKRIVEAEESTIGSWASGGDGSGVVPARMLQAEALLVASENAPSGRWKEKTAERALRIYYHAKWLAERNYASAAISRYRESARLAQQCRRSVLASHSLARLGYFLIHWRRSSEAAEALQESMKLSSKSNPLAPYLHGVLERTVADTDESRLRKAEDYILNAGEQPSEELEVERHRLISDISYWRDAEASWRQCFSSSDTAYVLICVLGHAGSFFRQFLFK